MNVPQPASETAATKRRTKSKSSIESMPSRCLTVMGNPTASRIALTQPATSSGSAMRQTPKAPFRTRSEGQPQLRLISS